MENQELYKQAILDAKAVRETAMAAAKESLAEAFEPRIKEMLRLKLSEELEEAEETTMEEAEDPTMEEAKHKMEEGDHNMEESTLDEILAELDAISEEPSDKEPIQEDFGLVTAPLIALLLTIAAIGFGIRKDTKEALKAAQANPDDKQAMDNAKAAIEQDPEAKKALEAAVKAGALKGIGKAMGGVNESLTFEETDAKGEAEATEDTEVVELTVGELKDIFRDVFAQFQGGNAEMGGEEEMEMEVPAEDEMGDELKELSLDEILAELEEEEDATMEEGMEKIQKPGGTPAGYKSAEPAIEEKKKMMEEELEEAKKAIATMREELQEVNLLNAKLLYVNKLLKAKPLTESQKIKVLNAFDRATTVKETENIYKTLNESLATSKTKNSLKESVGFASKPIGSAPVKPIVEMDSMVARWQQIAGIKK